MPPSPWLKQLSRKSLWSLSPKRSKKSLEFARAGATPTTTTSATIAAIIISFLKAFLARHLRFLRTEKASHVGVGRHPLKGGFRPPKSMISGALDPREGWGLCYALGGHSRGRSPRNPLRELRLF